MAVIRDVPRQRLAALSERVGPGALAHERTLAVVPALESLLPAGLRRGSVVVTEGVAATSMALALAAGPSAAGAWLGVVGMPSLGVLAAAELGVAVERLFLVAAPPVEQWAEIVAAVIDGAELVMATPPPGLRAAAARRVWWPILAVAALVSRRGRWWAALAVLSDVRAAPTDLAYGWGVWAGMRRLRTIAPLVPRLSAWPERQSRRTLPHVPRRAHGEDDH